MRTILERDGLVATARASVADVDAEQWDGLARGSFYAGHAWSRYQERDPSTESWVVTVHRGEDLVAATSLHRSKHEASSGYDLASRLGCGDGVGVLLCGNRRGYDNRLLLRDGVPEARSVLVEAVLSEAERLGAGLAVWPYLDDASVLELGPSLPDPEPRLLTVTGHFDLPGEGFEDFLASLPARRRADVRRDRRRFEESGRVLQVGRPDSTELARVAVLVANVEHKHGSPTDVERLRLLLGAQVEDVGGAARLVSCLDGSDLLACSLAFAGGSELAVRVAGLDHQRVGSGAEYFETVFYRPIELGYALDVSRVSVGFGSLRTKRHRGATLTPRWAVPFVVDDRVRLRPAREHDASVRADLVADEGLDPTSVVSDLWSASAA